VERLHGDRALGRVGLQRSAGASLFRKHLAQSPCGAGRPLPAGLLCRHRVRTNYADAQFNSDADGLKGVADKLTSNQGLSQDLKDNSADWETWQKLNADHVNDLKKAIDDLPATHTVTIDWFVGAPPPATPPGTPTPNLGQPRAAADSDGRWLGGARLAADDVSRGRKARRGRRDVLGCR
jgi:hypothetical protein